MTDEEVVALAKTGHIGATEYLIGRYRPIVEAKAKTYFVVGADRDDVIQEGLIGLYKSIRDFRSDRLTKFKPFAELCITRQIITAVKTATRQKHLPLNSYVSLYPGSKAEPGLVEAVPDRSSAGAFETPSLDDLPADLSEAVRNTLSELERAVLRCYLDGMSYREMSDQLKCHTKSIDNALQRVKKKIGVLLRI